MPPKPLITLPKHLCQLTRTLSTNAPLHRLKTSNSPLETSMSSARHKPRLSSMSFGLLISELNSNNLTEGTKIPDSDRTILRKVGYWVLGVPVVVGVMGSLVILNERRRRRTKQWEAEQDVEEG